MHTTIYAYKDHLGIDLDIEKGEGFLNDPKASGQLGTVIDTKYVDITKDAIELLKNAKREGGSFAPIMLTKHAGNVNSKSSFGIMGFGKQIISKDNILIGRDCETSILSDMNEVELNIPEDLKEAIDN